MIEKKVYSEERSLYSLHNEEVSECLFESEIGESPLKEASNICVKNSQFKIRYPFWHNTNTTVTDSLLEVASRAPFWYDKSLTLNNVTINSVKAIRESTNVLIEKSHITTDEFCWKCEKVTIMESDIVSNYAFLDSIEIDFINNHFGGKYAFQYVKNVTIKDSILDTKDAFWHSQNVTVINSTINSEYLGWYSKNLTLINCKLTGIQPLCYAENVKLVNCEMLDADLSFEYSTIDIDANNVIKSIKNPLKGTIKAKAIGQIIFDENRRDSDGDVIIEVENDSLN